ncbi:zinc finger protein 830 isoform X1 [Iris pallida]|uniref:Zinc finger protein 830 isoform X1 n=1 Tax=Iris pallida TaxID=29817 RepID=A0AAX6DG17_IRIPA|nr:zinc finger protein 830 isoform X1 [Iris pallida]
MDSRAQRKALFRSKVRESSQKRDKRIDSPLVRYNEYEQPVCRVCNVVLKSEALWPAHQASRKHHEAIENVKAAAAGVSQDSKIHKDQQVEVHKPHSSSILPEGFFDNQEAKREKSDTAVVRLASGSSSSDLPHKRKEVPHSSGHTEVPVSSKKATVLANDHLVENKERNENKGFTELDQPSKKTDYSHGKQIKGALPESFFDNKERNDSQTVNQVSEEPISINHLEIGQVKGGLPKDLESTKAKGALPEGFFDNKDADLRARGIKPVKVDINDAYKEFEKEIQDDLQEVDARLEEEEIDAAYVREEFESLEQKEYREKVDMVKKQLMEFKAARLARGQKSPAFMGKELSDESSSDEDDESFAVDWRAKHL